MSRIPVPASHCAATPKVSIGTVALRPDPRGTDPCAGACERSSTGPHRTCAVEHVRAVRPMHQGASGLSASSDSITCGSGWYRPRPAPLRPRRARANRRRRPPPIRRRSAPLRSRARSASPWARHAGSERIGVRAEFLAGEDVEHSGRCERRPGVDRNDARGRVRRCDQRDVFHAGKHDVGDKAAAAGNEARMLLCAALRADVTELVMGFFPSSLRRVPPQAAGGRVLWSNHPGASRHPSLSKEGKPRALRRSAHFASFRRSAASCTASTICWYRCSAQVAADGVADLRLEGFGFEFSRP